MIETEEKAYIPEEVKETQGSTLKVVPSILSVLFHPLLVPLYAYVLLFSFTYLNIMPFQYVAFVLSIVASFTLVSPLLFIGLYKWLNKYSLKEILEACKYYFEKTGRRITFEYSLVAGVNDTKEDAEELIHLIKGMNCHVNLIPVNPIKERDYKQSNKEQIQQFKARIEKSGISATVRREMGRDIDGACGQLRRKHIRNQL